MGPACVIFNPSAGRRRAARRMESFRQRWQSAADFWPTESPGHAQTLAQQAVEKGYRIVAAAGGDGTVHEVANGILQTDTQDVTFAVVPVGSANDYAHSLKHQFGTAELEDDVAHRVDVGVLQTSDDRQQYFVAGMGVGLNGQITAESRRIPHRQGLWLYGLAAFRVLWRREPPITLHLSWDDEPTVETSTRLLSVLLGQREGNFPMARQALLDDGQFDIVHGGDISAWQALSLLPRFLLSGPPDNHPQITLRHCQRLRIESDEPLAIHTDGEVFGSAEAPVRELDVQLLPRRLPVKVCPL